VWRRLEGVIPRNGSGVYSLPAGTINATGDTILAAEWNAAFNDLGSEITASLPVSGDKGMTGDLPMGTNKITGLGVGTASTDGVTLGQVFGGVSAKGGADYTVLATDGGKVITFDGSAAIRTVTLLAAASAGDGFTVTVKKVGGGDYPIVIDADGTETVDGALTLHIRDDDAAVTLRSDASNWQVIAETGSSADKAGTVKEFAGATVPQGYLLCDGSEYAEAIYVTLFAAISTTWNTGGETVDFFRVPDRTGRTAVGKEASATRLTSAGGGVDGGVLGDTGGGETHVLVEAELAAHTHGPGTLGTDDPGTHTHPSTKLAGGSLGFQGSASLAESFTASGAGGAHTHTVTTGATASAGSDTAHANVQPTIVMNFMIKI